MTALLRRQSAFQTLLQCQRAFSTSVPRAVSLQWEKNDSEALKDALPEYPYGPTRWYKQSARGLYGGQRVQFGNNVGKEFGTKSRRRWNPNVHTKRLWSQALNRFVQIRVTTRVLRTIDKLGGLDEYLLGEKETRIRELGESGWWLRWAIMQTPAIKSRHRRERAALGLPEDPGTLDAVEEGVEASGAEEGAEEVEVEEVVLDDTFKIEQNPDLPPLKFRTEPRKHIMLTERGWVRTRPSKDRWVNLAKERIMNSDNFATWKSDRMLKARNELEASQKRAVIREQCRGLEQRIENLETQQAVELDSSESNDQRDEITAKYAETIQALREEQKALIPDPEQIGGADVILNQKEQAYLLEQVKKALNKELKEKINERYEQQKKQHDRRVASRRVARKAKKVAREEVQEVL